MEETTALLATEMEVPYSDFTLARRDAQGRRIPQTIAHRGYRAAHPENTMGAFRGAVDVGAHAIETDIHLSKDSVVVLSHDPDLKRCFGRKEKIVDCDWSFLETLRTTKEPYEPMPRLKDLLEYLTTPGSEDIWVLLDMKRDNNAEDVMRLIAATIAEVKPTRPWHGRVVLGCWAAKYLPLCAQYLPGFPVTHIGLSISYARQFLKVPNISFNMLQRVMIGPMGNRFMQDCKKAKRPFFLWTVDEDEWMRWSIKKEVDGVITDDPKKFLEVSKDYDEKSPIHRLPIKEYPSVIWVNLLVLVFSIPFRYRYGFSIDPEKVKIETRSSSPPLKLA